MKQNSKVQILEFDAKVEDFLFSNHIGLAKGEWIEIVGETLSKDYILVQIHSKVFAIPHIIFERIKVSS